jgi:hypothetical protein
MKLTAFALTAITLGTLLASAAPAAAATNPYLCGNYCDGKSPTTLFWDDRNHVYYRCSDDARTIYTKSGTNHATVELRYSAKCETAWARIANTDYGFRVQSFYSGGGLRKTYNGDLGTNYTRMVNDRVGLEARACVYIPYGDWTCTGKY